MEKVVINQMPVADLRGKRVFVRIDANIELSSPGVFADETKLRASLPTLEYLTDAGAYVIVGTHLGSPGGRVVESLRLDPVARRLSELLDKPVRKLGEAIGREALRAVADMRSDEIVLLENLRFYPGEDTNDAKFAQGLSELCDVYCDEAFALAHHGLASTVGITRYVRPATAGLELARELMMFEAVLDKPVRPFFAIVAGARLDEKLPLLENLLPRLNQLFIGGALSFTFYKAKWLDVGGAPVDEEFLPLVEDFLQKAEKQKVEILLPEDFVVVRTDDLRAFEKSGGQLPFPASKQLLYDEITSSEMPVDIGPRTFKRIKDRIDDARTLFWNGPLGMWEIEPFAAGTREVARVIVKRGASRYQRVMICGDSLTRAIRSFDLPFERLRHLTTGGQSALELLAGNPLPAVEALDDEADLVAPIKKRPRTILLAVDGSAHSLEAARKIGSLIEAEGAEISLVYVQKPKLYVPEGLWVDPEIERQIDVERQLEAEKIFAAVNAELARQGLVSHLQIAVQGEPADEILRFADELNADLIAMGSHGKTGILSLIMGSVSRKVLNHATRPVLIVRMPDPEMVEAGLIET
jgi:phosphoglycerate kinase